MTGAEHYKEADRIIAVVRKHAQDGATTQANVLANLAMAQVHATLALAAATAWGRVGLPSTNGDQHGYGL